MLCIEEVRSSLPVRDPELVAVEVADGKADTLASYVELHTAYKALQESYASMKSELEEEKDSHAEYLKLTAEARKKTATGDGKMENQYKAEIDKLQGELVKAERIIADAELSSARQANDIANLSKQVDELSIKATQADKLKDEVDEYRHAAEKLRKAEASIEKLRKKLEDSAEVKRQIKVLEDENLTLMQKNSQLEGDLEAREDFKLLLDQYKSAAQELEVNNRELAKEKEALQLSHRDDQIKISAMLEEREKHAETVSLLEERIRQLEVAQQGPTSASRVRGSEEAGSDEEDSANELSGIANELDDALSGVTTTELKLKIRKLQRNLEAATSNKAVSSRINVLETLLEDAQKMKTRYEQDFLKEYREKLILQRRLDEIHDGKTVGLEGWAKSPTLHRTS
jgi:protein HOOK3